MKGLQTTSGVRRVEDGNAMAQTGRLDVEVVPEWRPPVACLDPSSHAAAGRPPRRPEWGLPASVLANLQCSIDSARLSLRSARASDQIGKDRRWGRPSGDGDGRRRARHGGRDRGETRPASAAGEEVEALALGQRNNAGTSSSRFESRRAGWKLGRTLEEARTTCRHARALDGAGLRVAEGA
jgi:hypothetical protein